MSLVKKPRLLYPIYETGLEYVLGSPQIHNVHEVSVGMWTDGLSVWVTGRLRKKDGTPSQRNGGVEVDLTVSQPAWLAHIIADAEGRLS